MVQPKLSRWDKMRRHPVIHRSQTKTWRVKDLEALPNWKVLEMQTRWVHKVNQVMRPVRVDAVQNPMTHDITFTWRKERHG